MILSSILNAILLVSICLTSSTASVIRRQEGTHVLVGYTRVGEKHEKFLNENGFVYRKDKKKRQLGEGIYITNDRDVFKAKDKTAYCLVWARKDALDAAPKAWIPKKNEDDKDLWFNPKNLKKYVREEHDMEPRTAILLAIIKGREDDQDVLMKIPPYTVEDTTFDWKFECRRNKWDVHNVRIDWENLDNVSGSKD